MINPMVKPMINPLAVLCCWGSTKKPEPQDSRLLHPRCGNTHAAAEIFGRGRAKNLPAISALAV